MTEIVLPQHANALGTAFGGTVMGWMDICAAVTAQRHCGQVAVTASVDDLEFVAPVRVGDVVVLEGRVNAVFRTSLEICVRVEREELNDMSRILASESLFTFVNVDQHGKPTAVPELSLETEEDKQRAHEATKRRRARVARRT